MHQLSGGVTSNVDVIIERVYPGMETFERVINVTNKGDLSAELSYEIESAKIMDEYYEIGQTLPGETNPLTSEDIEDIITNNYPFKITIETDETNIHAIDGTGTYTITVSWPFESGDDDLDTEWGNKAYNFYNTHPGEESIDIQLLLIATQSSGQ